MPAATSAPNATRRMTSVSGIENRPARLRSSANDVLERLVGALAERADIELGIRPLHFGDRGNDGIDLVRRVLGRPRISIGTSAECLSAEMNPLFSASNGDLTSPTASSFETPAITAWTAALKAGSSVVNESLWIRTSSPAG